MGDTMPNRFWDWPEPDAQRYYRHHLDN